jgi:hypothetical protein
MPLPDTFHKLSSKHVQQNPQFEWSLWQMTDYWNLDLALSFVWLKKR